MARLGTAHHRDREASSRHAPSPAEQHRDDNARAMDREIDSALHAARIPARGADATTRRVDEHAPPGWSYNPASWRQRLPVVALAVVGGCVAGYLALYQYGVVRDVWEPFFGDGSRRILHSSISFALPVSDATLGALGYLADALAGVIGGVRRWRTMPWIVVLFGILVGPLGAVSIALVIAQPVVYHTFCTLCLLSAVISMLMIGPAMDEVLASLQYLRRVSRTPERSVWRAFWGIGRDDLSAPLTRGKRGGAQ
ncbi:MAG TPA: vitamin K epoxide reductase family protein [Gemmatimonadaceae bacterium]|nr:vitamin K epoxide reductase family protein [Gemmatimonadaceae bacterium]